MASSITDDGYKPIEEKKPKALAEDTDKDQKESDMQYTQAIKCVKCLNVIAYMGVHRHRPGPVICALCTTRMNKEAAKKKKP